MPRPPLDLGHIKGPVYIPNCAQIRLIWTLPNLKRASNILHVSYSTQPTPTQTWINTMQTAINNAFTTSTLPPQIHASTQLTAVGFRDLQYNATQQAGYTEWLSNQAGVNGSAAAGSPLPANVTYVVSLKTGLGRQANRGRVYIPGFSIVASTAAGVAVTGVQTGAVDFITKVQTALSATSPSLVLVVAHPARAAYTGRTGVQYGARSAGFVTVTNIVGRDVIWDTQRLRVKP